MILDKHFDYTVLDDPLDELINGEMKAIQFLLDVGRDAAPPKIGSKPVDQRYWEKIDISDGCWYWNAGKHYTGHGIFPHGKEWLGETRAHRIMWTLAMGPIKGNQFCHHHCGNTSCVNPEHLYLAPARKKWKEEKKVRTVGNLSETLELNVYRRLYCGQKHSEIEERTGVSRYFQHQIAKKHGLY